MSFSKAKTTVWRHDFFLSYQTYIKIVHAEVTETTIVSETDKQAIALILLIQWTEHGKLRETYLFFCCLSGLPQGMNLSPTTKPTVPITVAEAMAATITHGFAVVNTKDTAPRKLKVKPCSIDVLCKGKNFFVYFVYLLLLILLLLVTF